MKIAIPNIVALLLLLFTSGCLLEEVETPIPNVVPPDYREHFVGNFQFDVHSSGFYMHSGPYDSTWSYSGAVTLSGDSSLKFQMGQEYFTGAAVDPVGQFFFSGTNYGTPAVHIEGGFFGLDSLHYEYHVWHLSFNNDIVANGRRIP